ncbi:hypothetical protein KAR91_44580 [Candidatus Pacearchaeota archaeon]|nr:hypothetical protein [Candidatus Pacearchaeota archaeon]
MTKKKTEIFEDLIEKVSEVKETTKPGRYRVAFLRSELWYGLLESKAICEDARKNALEAIEGKQVVRFDYHIDGEWNNIDKVLSWNCAIHDGDNISEEEEPEIDEKKEKAIAKAHAEEEAKKLEIHRKKRITHMTECLEDAQEAYEKITKVKTPFDAADKENIRAIAISFMIRDNQRGR